MHNFAHPSVCICSALKYPPGVGFGAGVEWGRGEGVHPRRALTRVGIASQMDVPQPSVCTGQPPVAVQPALLHWFVLGWLAWRMAVFFWGYFLFLFSYERRSLGKMMWAF